MDTKFEHRAMWRQGAVRAIRSFRTDPSFSWLVTIAFALSMTVSAIAFSIVDAVVLRPLPFRDSGRLERIWETETVRGRSNSDVMVSGQDYLAWKAELPSAEEIGVSSSAMFAMRLPDRTASVYGARVSTNYFSMLGTPLFLGPGFPPGEPRNDYSAVVISYKFWTTQFNRDPDICKKLMVLDGIPTPIVGVLPESFHNRHFVEGDSSLYIPVTTDWLRAQTGHGLLGIARLRKGATLAQLDEELKVAMSRLARLSPVSSSGWGAWATPLRYELLGDDPAIVWTVMGIVLLVCTIAVANVAALFLARSVRMLGGLRTRLALGAGAAAVAIESFSEGLMYAAIGLIAGVPLLAVAIPVFARLVPLEIFRIGEMSFDWRVLLFAAGFQFLAAVCVTVPPTIFAVRAARSPSISLMNRSTRGEGFWATRIRDGVMGAQFVLVILVVTLASVAAVHLTKLESADLGFDPHGVSMLPLSPSRAKYPKFEEGFVYLEQALASARRVPGVREAALTTAYPLSGDDVTIQVSTTLNGMTRPTELKSVYMRGVSRGYFKLMRIPLFRGRDFSDGDAQGRNRVPAVVNQLLANHLWPEQDPIGKQMWVSDPPSRDSVYEIVGIVGNVHHGGLSPKGVEEEVYVPLEQGPMRSAFLMIRALGNSRDLFQPFMRIIAQVDDSQSLSLEGPGTLDHEIDRILRRPWFYASSLLLLSLASIMLALYGLYGSVSYSVQRRSNEIAVRLCLGATFRHIAMSTVRAISVAAIAGVITGTVCCIYAVPWIMVQLQISFDYGAGFQMGITFFVAIFALAAILVPLKRAMRIEPGQLLRYE